MEGFEQRLAFTVDGHPPDTFVVFRLTGREAISELFSFQVDVLSGSTELAAGSVVGQGASLTFERHGESREIYGMVERFELNGITPYGEYVYRAVLVPRLHKLAMTRQNQIHGTASAVSIREVLNDELTAASLKGKAVARVSGRLGLNDFEIRLTHEYPRRDYIVQYDESDFAFVSRLCEHYGIFYFFVHENGKDAVVFGDSRITFPVIEGSGHIAFRPPSGLANTGEASVFRFTGCTRMVPAAVCLRDYNYRLPNLTLEVDETVDPDGHGVVVEYGSHFRTPQEGRDLARVRAQELASRKLVFSGASDSVLMTAGAVFDLTDHFHQEFNDGYLITWIEHEATQAVAGIGEFAGPEHQTSYRNRFECLPRSVEFRPARVTPKPKVAGLTNAMVDASGSGQRAELDASGRYKIRQQFDQRGESAGQASRYMRKAEPYGGANSGMHFPLLKGTEVIVACVNGDPDRPIIVGAMQNELHPSIVTSSSNTANRLQTTSGALFEIDDGPGSNGGSGSGAFSGAAMMPQRALQGGVEPPATAAGSAVATAVTQPLTPQRAEATITTDSGDSSYAKLSVNSGTTSEAYWRLGNTASEPAYQTPAIPNVTGGSTSGDVPGGIGIMEYSQGVRSSLIHLSSYTQVDVDRFDYTGGEHRQIADKNVSVSGVSQSILSKAITIEAAKTITTSTTEPGVSGYLNDTTERSDIGAVAGDGEVRINTSDDLRFNVGGNYWNEVAGWAMGVYKGFSGSYTLGDTGDFQFGANFNFIMGGSFEFTIGLDFELSGMFRVDVFLGGTLELRYGPKYEFNSSPSVEWVPAKFESPAVSMKKEIMGMINKDIEIINSNFSASSLGIEVMAGNLEVKMKTISTHV